MKDGAGQMNAMIQTRVDAESKKQAEEILNRLGMSLNDAVRIFISQVVMARGLPFQPKLPTEEEFIAQAVADAEADVKAGRVSGSFSTVDELMADLEKDD